jgi:hypothetical protein
MNADTIFNVHSDGTLARMTPGAPPNEDHMQTLVARYPELIGDHDGPLLLIRREQPISDAADTSGRWSLDHLFVTREGVPVLVELKRAVDTRLRREVVGQMLDYAANAVAYWQVGTIAMAFAATCTAAGTDADSTLADFLGDGDPGAFWDQVDTNFQAGRLKLVFVADTIPRELARIVEFLNEQMKADVRAVELRWYQNPDGATTLVPRIFGETERAATQKSATRAKLGAMNVEQWIEKNIRPRGNDAIKGAEALISVLQELGGQIEVARTQGSIYGAFRSKNGTPYYPLHLHNNGQVTLSLAYLLKRPSLVEESARSSIYEVFRKAVGPLSTSNLQGYPGILVARLSEPDVCNEFRSAANQLIALASAD